MQGKKVLFIVVLILMVTAVTVYAASNYNSPAEIASNLTKKPIEDLIKEKIDTDKTYGELAKDADKYDEFREEMFKFKKGQIEEGVNQGRITRDQANKYFSEMEKHQEFCHSEGTRLKGESGIGFGFGHGHMMGKGHHGRMWE